MKLLCHRESDASVQADLVLWGVGAGGTGHMWGLQAALTRNNGRRFLVAQARLADMQATWLPEICSLKRLLSFTENLVAHLNFLGWMFSSSMASAMGQERRPQKSVESYATDTVSSGQASHITIINLTTASWAREAHVTSGSVGMLWKWQVVLNSNNKNNSVFSVLGWKECAKQYLVLNVT